MTQPRIRSHRARSAFGDFAPALVSYTDDVLFGDVWKRTHLTPKERSLVTVAALTTMGNTDQLVFHLDFAKQNGNTEAELIEAITHLAFYAGWPKAMAAMTVAKRVFAATPTERTHIMRGALLYAPGDIRVEQRDDPKIEHSTDAIIRLSATCVCGSDLWPYRGIEAIDGPAPMGHEYVGIVEEVGADVRNIKPSQFVIGSFFASDNTCEICRAGYQSSCIHRELVGAIGTQAEYARIPLADGTLVATPDVPPSDLVPSLLAASDVLGTGWFAAVAAEVAPGKTVAVVGDGAVGLLGVMAAKQLGAERIIAMSRHESRQHLAREFGATDIVAERGDDGVARIKDLTNGLGAHSVIEAVGTQESMMQAVRAARPGGHVGFVGVSHDVQLPGDELFFSAVHLHGGPAPVRRFLPELIDLIWNRAIDPGKVFDLTLRLDEAAEGYRAMDERRAIKTLLTV